MIPIEIRNYIDNNYYKKKGSKNYKYYDNNNKQVSLNDIMKNILYKFNIKIVKISLMKYIKIYTEPTLQESIVETHIDKHHGFKVLT